MLKYRISGNEQERQESKSKESQSMHAEADCTLQWCERLHAWMGIVDNVMSPELIAYQPERTTMAYDIQPGPTIYWGYNSERAEMRISCMPWHKFEYECRSFDKVHDPDPDHCWMMEINHDK